mmetsp:Transcript_38462/g.85863  ORF Transcript_38462/g.85863 Transcript_38462/m.85863 type:complete len:363 (-) Transcript_38462:182-1270(-)
MGSHGGCASQAKANGRDGASKVLGVPEHSDGASHGGCASQDKGRDGASKYQGLDDTSGGSSHGDVSSSGGCASQDKGRDGASKAQGQAGRDGESSSVGDAASQGQGQDRSVRPDAEPNSSLRELQTDYGFQFRVQDASDGEEDSSHRDVSSTGGCASQDQGRDGASKAQGQGRDGESSSNGDVASQAQAKGQDGQGQAKDQEDQGQGRDGASSSNGDAASQGQGQDRSVRPDAEPNSSLRELQTDYGLQFPLQDASDSDESLPPLSPLPPERVDCLHDVRRGPNYDAPVQTDPPPSTRFPSLVDFSSSLVDLHSKMIDLLLREQQGHQDLSTARFQVAQDGQRLASPSGGEPQHRVHQPGSR